MQFEYENLRLILNIKVCIIIFKIVVKHIYKDLQKYDIHIVFFK